MDSWQQDSGKHLLSASIHKDKGKYCCIALTNPMEVVICSGLGGDKKAYVDDDFRLHVHIER
jgi:hypothetical protein